MFSVGFATMSSRMAVDVDPNGKSLKEALCVQQRLLQKLYNELDVEREAAATAASEAMSMIHRLQGEKAAVKMEAEQFKRLAEEKMNHAEESMEIFEEIMYQKEMEIASLDYQVQAYRYKLMSLGYDDLGVHEMKYQENLLQRNESLGETSTKNTQKRLKLPNAKKGILERDRSITEDPDMIAKIVEESLRDEEYNQSFDLGMKTEFGSSSVDLNSYFEQIRKLDKVVEDMVGELFLSSDVKTSKSSSIPSKVNELDLVQYTHKTIDEKVPSNAGSPCVHDVFEVPEIDETLYKDEGKTVFKDDEKVKKLPSLPQSPVKSFHKDEIYSGKKSLLSRHKEPKVFLPEDSINVDCHLALVQPNTTTESVEQNVRQETAETKEDQELKLLYEINEKLDSIQTEIRSRNANIDKSSSSYDLPMLQLEEVINR